MARSSYYFSYLGAPREPLVVLYCCTKTKVVRAGAEGQIAAHQYKPIGAVADPIPAHIPKLFVF